MIVILYPLHVILNTGSVDISKSLRLALQVSFLVQVTSCRALDRPTSFEMFHQLIVIVVDCLNVMLVAHFTYGHLLLLLDKLIVPLLFLLQHLYLCVANAVRLLEQLRLLEIRPRRDGRYLLVLQMLLAASVDLLFQAHFLCV